MKSLSRKVSGHWKRGAGGSVSAGEEERGRQSLQEKRLARKGSKRGLSGSVGKDKEKSRERDAFAHTRRGSLRLSIDRFGSRERELDAGLMRLGGSELGHSTSPSTLGTLRRGAGVPVIPLTQPYVDVDAEETGGAGSVSKLTKPRKSEPPSNPGSGGGSKLWKLMKRISTSGLRDKFQQDDGPPPVPALPKEYEAFNSSRSNDGHSNVGSGNSHSKSISPPFDRPQHANSQVPKESGMLPGSPASANQSPIQRASMPPSRKLSAGNPRPSTTTRSSSPVYSSSDVASSRFFNRAHSTRSSSSSYGEEVPPPMPKPPMPVGQHIIPPNELQKLASEGHRSPVSASSPRSNPNSPSDSRKQSSLGPLQLPPFARKEEDWMIVTSPSVELPSLPFPPRRVNTIPAVVSLEEEMDRSESPIIPSFSTAGAINAFPSRRSLSSKASSPVSPPSSTVSSPAPPRPSRSVQRPSPLTSPQPTRLPSPEAVRTPQQFDTGRKSESYNPNRRSSGGFSTSTARPWRRSSSFGASPAQAISPSRPSTASASTSSRALLKFREMGSREEKKQMLTEKEKADKWDDLLERSARAGGTLHLGGGTEQLASDQISMRMSVASSAS
ncbi:hypothetical protein BDQ12DRAFT_692934 [Crucibulum laeve]|uniref:Uncharacterized protein n=1 Tax=Crucibulum laeve TaxID=68775 RepID=A0A5C3LGY7_9AGAR|nr:hypothetical protein BDQ12DRAFT_692934 [Crucibulum laeve]